MGKHKKQEKRPKSDSESESDSDSGPEDRNEPAPKKSKAEGSSSKRLKNDLGETYFELERNRRVSIREFRALSYRIYMIIVAYPFTLGMMR